MVWILTIGIVVILIVVWSILTYNKLVALSTRVAEGFSNIDVYLKKRYDLIPNLIAVVKKYVLHEQDTLEKVVLMRGKAINGDKQDISKNEKELSDALGRLLAITENYPNLKADGQFLNLQKELNQIESEIEKSRRYYNGSVTKYNIEIKKIPACIISKLCNFKEEKFFELTNQSERENVKVEF